MTQSLGGIPLKLKEEERILWEGRPVQGFLFTRSKLIWAGLGVVLALVGLWAILAGGFAGAMLGLPLLLAGLYLGAAHWFVDRNHRADTWYAISTSRAMIANRGRVLAYTIQAKSPISLKRGATDRLRFAITRQLGVQNGSSRRWVGFADLADGREAYELLLELKERAE